MRPAAWTWLAALTLVAACAPKSAPSTEVPPPEVKTLRVAPTAARPLLRRGVVELGDEMHLGFNAAGVIARILVRDGQAVRAGQLLAVLKDGDVTSRYAAAQGEADRARLEWESDDRLAKRGAIAPHQAEVRSADVKVASARLAEAANAVAQTRLTAPFAGVVRERVALVGEAVRPATPVLVLENPARRVVRLGLGAGELAGVRVGQDVALSTDAGVRAAARVANVAPTASAESGLYRVELDVLGTPDAIRPGEVVTAAFAPDPKATELRVPSDAVLYRRGQPLVFRVRTENGGTRVEARAIEPGRLDGREVAVVNGLAPDDVIVSEGGYFLLDGQTVAVR